MEQKVKMQVKRQPINRKHTDLLWFRAPQLLHPLSKIPLRIFTVFLPRIQSSYFTQAHNSNLPWFFEDPPTNFGFTWANQQPLWFFEDPQTNLGFTWANQQPLWFFEIHKLKEKLTKSSNRI